MILSPVPLPSRLAPIPGLAAGLSAFRASCRPGDGSGIGVPRPSRDMSAFRAFGPTGHLSAFRAFCQPAPDPLAPPRLLAESSPPTHRPARPNGGTP